MVLEQDSSPEYTVPDWQEARQITGICARRPQVLRPALCGRHPHARTGTTPLTVYIGEDCMDVLADGRWEKTFKVEATGIHQGGKEGLAGRP